MRPLKLSTQQIEDLVVATHRLDDLNRGAIAARVRYLQRLDFPRPTGGVRGRRLEYDLADVLRFVVVFRQLEWNQSPVRAMRAVAMNWSVIEQALVVGWRIARPLAERPADAAAIKVLAAIAPAALQEAAGDGDGEQGLETVQILRPSHLMEWMEGAAGDGDDAQFLLLDPVRLAHAVVQGLQEVCGFYDFEVDAAFEAVGERAFGTPSQEGWRLGR